MLIVDVCEKVRYQFFISSFTIHPVDHTNVRSKIYLQIFDMNTVEMTNSLNFCYCATKGQNLYTYKLTI